MGLSIKIIFLFVCSVFCFNINIYSSETSLRSFNLDNSGYSYQWANLETNFNTSLITMINSGTCPAALPFCTSNSYTFPASTDVANIGAVGCLSTTPNAAWYWMEIGNSGNIDIHISSGGDVDFICWGPFSSLSAACASNLMSNPGIDCSYSAAAAEDCNIVGAVSGQVYVLLITNYANIATNISFNQTGGTGTTNCGIIAPPITNNGPLCAGQTLNLSVTSPIPGASYSWTGPNGWTSNVMNPSIPNITTAQAGTYSMTITIGTQVSPPVTTQVIVNQLPAVTASASPITICSGSSTQLTGTVSTPLETVSGSSTFNWTGSIYDGGVSYYMGDYIQGVTSGLPADAVITSITYSTSVLTSSGSDYCNTWWGAEFHVNGTYIADACNVSNQTYSGLNGQLANNQTFRLWLYDIDNWNDLVNVGLTVTVNYTYTQNSTPSFSWAPSTGLSATNILNPTASPTSTTTYTLTASASGCPNNASVTVNVNPNVTPTFSALGPYCVGATPGLLPGSSTNSPTITGTWSPATISTASPGTIIYTFTPTAGQCAIPTTMSVTVNPLPTVSASASPSTICNGGSSSLTGSGAGSYSWSHGLGSGNPVSVNPSTTTTYTVTGSTLGCTNTASVTVNVNPNIIPTFSALGPYCVGAIPGLLPGSSTNSPAITGTWSPATISTASAGTIIYTFTPSAGQCATTANLSVIVTQPAAPTGLACYQTANFNSNTCTWDITGTLPAAPTGLACYQTANFNTTSCTWNITGTQPAAPTGLSCYQTATWNPTTCVWDITGTQPAAPTGLACYQTANFNTTSCTWNITGTQPAAPTGL
ncbi:MAG: hypothetical protein WCP69_12600, partial [Bacteroidota bacterium]